MRVVVGVGGGEEGGSVVVFEIMQGGVAVAVSVVSAGASVVACH